MKVLHIGRFTLSKTRQDAIREQIPDADIVHIDAGDEPAALAALSETTWVAICAGGLTAAVKEAVDRCGLPALRPVYVPFRTGRHARQGGYNERFAGYELVTATLAETVGIRRN